MSLVIAFLTVVDLELLRAIRYQASHMPKYKENIDWLSSDSEKDFQFMNDQDSAQIIAKMWKKRKEGDPIDKLHEDLLKNEEARKKRHAELDE